MVGRGGERRGFSVRGTDRTSISEERRKRSSRVTRKWVETEGRSVFVLGTKFLKTNLNNG